MKIVRGYTDRGTFGRWHTDDGWFICYSLEKPWADNMPFDSCVPEGDYGLVEYASPKFGETYALVNHDLDVGVYEGDAARYAILIHKANWAHQLQGCIAPGTSLSTLEGDWSVSASGVAYKKIMEEIEGGDTSLIITHAKGVL
jgi:hypothetical protein